MSDTIDDVKAWLDFAVAALTITEQVKDVAPNRLAMGDFTISRTEWAGPNQVPTPDGSLDNERLEGFLVEETIIRVNGEEVEPLTVEVGKYQSAEVAAKMVVTRWTLSHIADLFKTESERRNAEETRKEAEGVF